MNLMMCNVFYFPVTAGWLVPKDVPFSEPGTRARFLLKSSVTVQVCMKACIASSRSHGICRTTR